MCSVVILLRPGHKWPVLIAASRDEMADRPWLPPGRHWPDRPDIVAGCDVVSGGSWLGVNDYGLVAILLNTPHTIGPAVEFRSRGELVLEALDHADADLAADAMMALNPQAYRPFHLLIVDNRDAFLLTHKGDLVCQKLPEGFSMITALGRNNLASGHFKKWFPVFEAAEVPDPDDDMWDDWRRLMLAREYDPDAGPVEDMFIDRDDGLGTRSTAFIALSDARNVDGAVILKHLKHA